MKLTELEIHTIKKEYALMKSKEDFLNLLNHIKVLLYGEDAKLFTMKQLNYHINPKLNPNRYTQFSIPKKTGGQRMISAPNKGLKQIQYCLNIIFQVLFTPHQNAYGFLPEKSIVDNAKKHVGSIYVFNIDLKDFFSSIDQARVWARMKYPPFCLNNDRIMIANMVASLCCHKMEVERRSEQGDWKKQEKSVLPQGAPTSPILTNVICERLDYLLTGVAKRFGLKYSRYADDITFSSMHNVYQKEGEFIKELTRIVEQQGFSIKPQKTRLQKTGFRQEVTGLIVNEQVNVQKRYVKDLRKWIYYWETYGYARANAYFYPSYIKDKGPLKKGEPNMANVLAGKLEYLKMVKGYNNSTYLKLNKRYEALVNGVEITQVETTLDIWESQGIDEAMNFYYKDSISSAIKYEGYSSATTLFTL